MLCLSVIDDPTLLPFLEGDRSLTTTGLNGISFLYDEIIEDLDHCSAHFLAVLISSVVAVAAEVA